jgi:hypothetical protein
MPEETGFEVEWTTDVPEENGESDFDAGTVNVKDFRTFEAATAYARKIFPEDFFGSVRITEWESLPYEEGYPGRYKETVREWFYEGEGEPYPHKCYAY